MGGVDQLTVYINEAIDNAFYKNKYNFSCLAYLKSEKLKRNDILLFIKSPLYVAVKDQIDEMQIYLLDNLNSRYFKEAYDWIGKEKALKIKEYLEQIIYDVEYYEQSKRPGRKRKTTNK